MQLLLKHGANPNAQVSPTHMRHIISFLKHSTLAHCYAPTPFVAERPGHNSAHGPGPSEPRSRVLFLKSNNTRCSPMGRPSWMLTHCYRSSHAYARILCVLQSPRANHFVSTRPFFENRPGASRAKRARLAARSLGCLALYVYQYSHTEFDKCGTLAERSHSFNLFIQLRSDSRSPFY